MAHKKAAGSAKNLRDSQPKYRGVKLFGGQKALAGNIIIRQKGSQYECGKNTYVAADFTIHASVDGIVSFKKKNFKRFDGRTYLKTVVEILPTEKENAKVEEKKSVNVEKKESVKVEEKKSVKVEEKKSVKVEKKESVKAEKKESVKAEEKESAKAEKKEVAKKPVAKKALAEKKPVAKKTTAPKKDTAPKKAVAPKKKAPAKK